MKIEKVNENQIRCTLTKEDLASRHLKLSEIAYGTEKAKTLFRDMMQQANFELGFEAEDIPLMIEAIPMNSESIVLIITKVEDPEELDTRFSRFAPNLSDDYEEDDYDSEYDEQEGSDEIMDLFRQIQEGASDASVPVPTEDHAVDADTGRIRLFVFDSLRQVMDAAAVTAPHYEGFSTLYKDEKRGCYLLVMEQADTAPESFDRVCNVISEYGSLKRAMHTGISYLEEHCETLIEGDALGRLGNL